MWGTQYRVTNVTNMHAITFSCVDTVTSLVLVGDGKLVRIFCNVIGCTTVSVPVGVNTIGCNVGALVATVTVTTVTIIIIVILIVPPAITSRVTMNLADLACDINIGRGSTTTALATTASTITIAMITAVTRVTTITIPSSR